MTTITMDGKYMTRDGHSVRLLCTDCPITKWPVIGIIDGNGNTSRWDIEGRHEFGMCHNLSLIPVPRMVPLGPEDVPPGSVLRFSGWPMHEWASIESVTDLGAKLVECSRLSFAAMSAERWLIKRPGEDWQPCSKPAS